VGGRVIIIVGKLGVDKTYLKSVGDKRIQIDKYYEGYIKVTLGEVMGCIWGNWG